MFFDQNDLPADVRPCGKSPVWAPPADLTAWGQYWLGFLADQPGITQAWIAEVDELYAPHWIAQLTSESLLHQFPEDALQGVLRHGRIFTFEDHVELKSGGLFPLVHDGQVIGLLGLLSHQTDYLGAASLAWIRTLTGIISDSLFQEKNGVRARAEQSILRRLQGCLDVREALPAVLEDLAAGTQADVITVLRVPPGGQRFELLLAHGLSSTSLAKVKLYFETGMAGKPYFPNNQPHWVQDLQAYPSNHQLINRLDEEGLRGYCAVPMFAHSRLVGALEIAWRSPQYTRTDHTGFLTRIAGQLALAMERTFVVQDLRQTNAELMTRYNAMIEGLSRALELRDLETNGHTQRVSHLTMHLVEHMQFPREQWESIREGALLHDIGKIGIPDAILLKPGSLTPAERKVMEQHVVYGYNILVPFIQSRPVLDMALYHHERWDGLGYPHALMGEQIPLVARLFAVIDVFDALTSDRPYRTAWTRQRALDYIKEQAGSQFDPRIVRLFLEVARERN
jgi:putative nucleotidyltransferase with HDIG domain